MIKQTRNNSSSSSSSNKNNYNNNNNNNYNNNNDTATNVRFIFSWFKEYIYLEQETDCETMPLWKI